MNRKKILKISISVIVYLIILILWIFFIFSSIRETNLIVMDCITGFTIGILSCFIPWHWVLVFNDLRFEYEGNKCIIKDKEN